MYHKGYSVTVSLVCSVAVTLLGQVTSSATSAKKNEVDRWSSRGAPVIAAAVTDGLEVEVVWRCIAAHPIQSPSSSLLCHLLHLLVVIIIVVNQQPNVLDKQPSIVDQQPSVPRLLSEPHLLYGVSVVVDSVDDRI